MNKEATNDVKDDGRGRYNISAMDVAVAVGVAATVPTALSCCAACNSSSIFVGEKEAVVATTVQYMVRQTSYLLSASCYGRKDLSR